MRFSIKALHDWMLLNATGQNEKFEEKKMVGVVAMSLWCIFFYGWVYLELHAILFRNCSVFSEGVGYLKLSFNINCIFLLVRLNACNMSKWLIGRFPSLSYDVNVSRTWSQAWKRRPSPRPPPPEPQRALKPQADLREAAIWAQVARWRTKPRVQLHCLR